MLSTSRRRWDNAILLHSNVSALAFPTGAANAMSEKVRAMDGHSSRIGELVMLARGGGATATIPGPVFVCGLEEIAAIGAADVWNQIGLPLNNGSPITVTDKRGFSQLVRDVGSYKALKLYNSGSAFTGGGSIDVYYVPLDTTPM